MQDNKMIILFKYELLCQLIVSDDDLTGKVVTLKTQCQIYVLFKTVEMQK